jgi:hypothetical protein
VCLPTKSDVTPDATNVIVHFFNKHGGPTSSAAPVVNVGHINTVVNNNNNININVVAPASHVQDAHKKLKLFPYQDMDHISDEFKRAMVDMASKADGFVKAVQSMFQMTYFNPSQPHNMNIVVDMGPFRQLAVGMAMANSHTLAPVANRLR